MTPPIIKAVRAANDRLIVGPRGISAHWPDVDEDIAIWEVLGIEEDAYLRARREAPVG